MTAAEIVSSQVGLRSATCLALSADGKVLTFGHPGEVTTVDTIHAVSLDRWRKYRDDLKNPHTPNPPLGEISKFHYGYMAATSAAPRWLRFIGESKRVVIGFEDGTIVLDWTPDFSPKMTDGAAYYGVDHSRLLYNKGEAVHAAQWNPAGDRLATACWDGTVQIRQPSTNASVMILQGASDRVRDIAWNAEGTRLAGADGRQILVWDARTGQRLLTLPAKTSTIGWHPDGSQIASTNSAGVTIHDADSGELLQKIKPDRELDNDLHAIDEAVLSWSPNGHWIAVGYPSTGGNWRYGYISRKFEGVGVWDVERGVAVRWRDKAGPTSAFAWSPAGDRLASVFVESQLVETDEQGRKWYSEVDRPAVWDPATGRRLVMEDQHEGGVTSMAFSPDGRRIATAGSDQTVKLWDTATGHAMLTLRQFDQWVMDVAFSANGHQLFATGIDGRIYQFDATPFEKRAGR